MNDIKKTILKGMDIHELESWCQLNGFPKFRAKQIYEWLYSHGVEDSDKMINIPKKCKLIINQQCILTTLKIISKTISSNKQTVKYLFKTLEGNFIESVSMVDENGRHTVCISSQSGCNLGCEFCATAKMGLMQNLSMGEIIDQLIIIRQFSKRPINNYILPITV